MRRHLLTIPCVLFLVAYYLVYPIAMYNKGTSENVEIEVLLQPLIESDVLVYKWSGDLVRACEVEIRRKIIDRQDVVTELTTTHYGKPPSSDLRRMVREPRVEVPIGIPEGPATYQATEIPKCNWIQRLFPVAVPYPPVHFTVTR